MQNGKAKAIIDFYKTIYIRYRNREPRRPDARVPEDRAMAESYLRWCADNDVDEELYMQERIRYMHEKRGIVLLFRFLKSEAALKVWRDGLGYRVMEAQASEAAMATMDDKFTQLIRDLGRLQPVHEQFKRRHWISNRLDICSFSPDCSGGYHPLSQFCPYCPNGDTCIERLRGQYDFDVIALRAKRFDLLPDAVAKIAATG
jgi:hypothetical protein